MLLHYFLIAFNSLHNVHFYNKVGVHVCTILVLSHFSLKLVTWLSVVWGRHLCPAHNCWSPQTLIQAHLLQGFRDVIDRADVSWFQVCTGKREMYQLEKRTDVVIEILISPYWKFWLGFQTTKSSFYEFTKKKSYKMNMTSLHNYMSI